MPLTTWPTARFETSPEASVTVLLFATAGNAAEVAEAGAMTKSPLISMSAAEVTVLSPTVAPRKKLGVPLALALQTGLASGVRSNVNLAISAAKVAAPCVDRTRHWPAPVPRVRLKVPVLWKPPL